MAQDIRNMPEGFGGNEFQNVTNIHPLALITVVVLGIATIISPKRLSLIPLLVIVCFISAVQKITVVELDFNLIRIMILFGVVRVLFRKEYLHFVRTPLDTAVVFWICSSVFFYILNYQDFASIINRVGFTFDVLGMYFLFRCLIHDFNDLDKIVAGLIWISVPTALFFLLEKYSGRNLFSIFGGVPEFTAVREGRLRCQGAFSHPIIAGCFWAALLPIFVSYCWKSDRKKKLGIVGSVMSLIIVYCSGSSTPIMGVIAAIISGLFFFLRNHMRVVRWSVLLTLIALHMVMNAPVWHLISRVSAVGGSTGYFRYMLIDSAIKRFDEWAIMGTRSTAHWFWGAQDLCNQYVYEGVMGGFLSLILFVAVIAIAFRSIGRLWRLQTHNPYRLALSWALGSSLFVHCMNFIGVSYFGQIWVIWYLLLAVIGSLSVENLAFPFPAIRHNRNNSNKRHPEHIKAGGFR